MNFIQRTPTVEARRRGCYPRLVHRFFIMNEEETIKEETIKPPDIESERVWKQKRCIELVRAIARYHAAGRCMDEVWFLELGKLIPETFPERTSST